MIHADRVRWDAEASHVRLKSGRRFVIDAPFAETKGLLGGFYVIGRAAKDEAIEWAKKIPLREDRTVEVREVWPSTCVGWWENRQMLWPPANGSSL